MRPGLGRAQKLERAGAFPYLRVAALSALACGAATLLSASPLRFAVRTVCIVAVLASALGALWFPVGYRFFGLFSVALVAACVHFPLQELFRTRYLYEFPLRNGQMFRSGEYVRYRTLDAADWAQLALVGIGALFFVFVGLGALTDRLRNHSSEERATGFDPGTYGRVVVALPIAALFGVAIGYFRQDHGFVVGIQGLVVGIALGLSAGKVLSSGRPAPWTGGGRETVLLLLTAGFLIGEIIGIGLAQRTFAPDLWLQEMLRWDAHEHLFGFSRYAWEVRHLRPGPVAWVLFNFLDIIFQVFMTAIMLGMGRRLP